MATSWVHRIPPKARLPLVLLAVAGVLMVLSFSGSGEPDQDTADVPVTAAAKKQVERAGDRLDQAGIFVAPAVPLNRIDGAAYDELKALAREHPGPARVAVLPETAAKKASAEQLLVALHQRVGSPGVYAVVIDRDGTAELVAAQWTEERPFYRINEAVAHATDCCVRDYPELLTRFLEDSSAAKPRPVRMILTGLLVTLGLAAAIVVGLVLLRRFRNERNDGTELTLLRAEIDDELTGIEQRAAGLPTDRPRSNDRLGHRYAHARAIAQEARGRHDKARTLTDAGAVVALIADFRFQLTAIDALRQGRAAPDRRPPCLIDPRHGPSVTERVYADDHDDRALVDVCAHCADALDHNQRPLPRRLPVPGGTRVAYWEAGRIGDTYLNGYRAVVPFVGGAAAYRQSETGPRTDPPRALEVGD